MKIIINIKDICLDILMTSLTGSRLGQMNERAKYTKGTFKLIIVNKLNTQ